MCEYDIKPKNLNKSINLFTDNRNLEIYINKIKIGSFKYKLKKSKYIIKIKYNVPLISVNDLLDDCSVLL